MSTTMNAKTAIPSGPDARVLARVPDEGYGPGAWHGPDLKAALADVTLELAFWRPGPARHNIAEIAIHHAYYVHSVRGRLLGTAPEPFVLQGEDWFKLEGRAGMSWPEIVAMVEKEYGRLAASVADICAARVQSPLPEAERFDLILGITCHAVYHAGQIQLIKRLRAIENTVRAS
jgi:hypothetical protein